MSLRVRMLVVCAAVVLVVVPGMAVAGTGTGAPTSDDAQMIADAIRAEDHIVIAYNDKNWDDLRALYMDDALMLPPNHEPVRGRDAIVEYLRGLRDAAGPISKIEHVRVRGSGTLANLVGKFSIQSGQVRMMTNEVYERQPDGSVLSGIDEFSFRDAAS